MGTGTGGPHRSRQTDDDAAGASSRDGAPVDAERLLRALYNHLTVAREEDVFRFMGLGPAPGWQAFRAHYSRDGRPDPEWAFADVAAHPATRARIEKMRSEFRAVIDRHNRRPDFGSHRG